MLVLAMALLLAAGACNAAGESTLSPLTDASRPHGAPPDDSPVHPENCHRLAEALHHLGYIAAGSNSRQLRHKGDDDGYTYSPVPVYDVIPKDSLYYSASPSPSPLPSPSPPVNLGTPPPTPAGVPCYTPSVSPSPASLPSPPPGTTIIYSPPPYPPAYPPPPVYPPPPPYPTPIILGAPPPVYPPPTYSPAHRSPTPSPPARSCGGKSCKKGHVSAALVA